ncbi:MAG: PaaI family thioesterase [Promethearchaeota archaeon]
MSEKKIITKRSEKIVKLFSAAIGMEISKLPGPIPAFSKWLNGKIIKVRRGEIEMEFELREEMANPTGLLHGGVQAAIMDDTVGMCTATLGYEGFLITIDSQYNYLGKVKIKEKVRVNAKLIREGKNIVHFFAQIKDLNGTLIATGNANLLKTQYIPEYIRKIDKEKDLI